MGLSATLRLRLPDADLVRRALAPEAARQPVLLRTRGHTLRIRLTANHPPELRSQTNAWLRLVEVAVACARAA